MKVIFLDIDGVLNSWLDCYESHNFGDSIYETKDLRDGHPIQIFEHQLEPRKLKLLQKIIDRTGAKIVVSSYWRLWIPENEFLPMFRKSYPDFNGEIVGTTSHQMKLSYCPRSFEIEDFLKGHPEITSYLIIDDTWEAARPNDVLTERFIKTDPDVGLIEPHVDQAVRILETL